METGTGTLIVLQRGNNCNPTGRFTDKLPPFKNLSLLLINNSYELLFTRCMWLIVQLQPDGGVKATCGGFSSSWRRPGDESGLVQTWIRLLYV